MAIAPLLRLTPEDTERIIDPVHMQPKTLLGTEIGQFIEWINGAGIDRPSTANDTKRLKALIKEVHRFTKCTPFFTRY